MRESVSPRAETLLLGHMLAECLPLGQVPSSMPSPPQPAPRHTSLKAHTLVSLDASSCLMMTQSGARAAKLLLVARTSPLSLVTNHGYFWLNSSENSAGCSVLGELHFGLAADSLLPRRNDQCSKHHYELHFAFLRWERRPWDLRSSQADSPGSNSTWSIRAGLRISGVGVIPAING